MPHAALCVLGLCSSLSCVARSRSVSMPHAALCVLGHCEASCVMIRILFQCRTQHCVCRDHHIFAEEPISRGFQCRTQHCVCRDTMSRSPCPARAEKAFWKDALFAPFLASADELCPEKWGSHRRCPLCGAGCTVLERRNGGMRLCARAGALSISFSSYLMIAHASFFFNDVFASMQRGR